MSWSSMSLCHMIKVVGKPIRQSVNQWIDVKLAVEVTAARRAFETVWREDGHLNSTWKKPANKKTCRCKKKKSCLLPLGKTVQETGIFDGKIQDVVCVGLRALFLEASKDPSKERCQECAMHVRPGPCKNHSSKPGQFCEEIVGAVTPHLKELEGNEMHMMHEHAPLSDISTSSHSQKVL